MKSQQPNKLKLPELYNPKRTIKLPSPMKAIRLEKLPKISPQISIGRKRQGLQ